ncbi:GTP 3',8-cyclase MoaA [Azorhizobium oxalatiphilum]|uniref:GTP 3',8-cyclase MoaA n=1 Tax=Azorhizobium oxalatiphilum TaxID=980631 RepID=UPI001AED8C91|nr:GTP 3',8-cyclase MoaA [Azorhizobium oxalatiphilum]
MVDGFCRQIRYLRLSVTDRCDMRCLYCMAEHATFAPRRELLSLEELYRLAAIFIRRGIRKIRLTGGEPLVRKDVMRLVADLSPHLADGSLDELTLTTNGSQLKRFAGDLVSAGVRRVNVSLDTLDACRYAAITRWGRLERVMEGIDAAQAAGLHVKLNAVAVKGQIETEVDSLIAFAHGRGMDLTLIEEMPFGDTGRNGPGSFLSLQELRNSLAERWTLVPVLDRTSGPARYVRVAETGGRLGFITPLSCDFCAGCDRLRVGSTGQLYTCMGHEEPVSLRDVLRANPEDDRQVEQLISRAVMGKPRGHGFGMDGGGALKRPMSALGG